MNFVVVAILVVVYNYPMSTGGVEFEEDSFGYNKKPRYGNLSGGGNSNLSVGGGKEPKMVNFLMRHGIVKSSRTGQYILIAIVIVNTIIAYIMFRYYS